MDAKPLRLGIVGGNRGGRFKVTIEALSHLVRLSAICDLREDTVRLWQAEYPELKGYTDYDRLLEDPDVDAVLLASPMLLHARQAVRALRAGKHVLSEVTAAHTLEDAWELVETVESTGLTYMMSENYCFERASMTVQRMAEAGVFGEITYLEGGYIHDLRHAVHTEDGSLTWRGELHRDYDGLNYPTHSIGPLAKWLWLGREGGDRLASLSAFTSNSRALQHYFRDKFGAGHPAAMDGYWKQGDSAVAHLTTEAGVLIALRVDWTSPRPHNMHSYSLQGTKGAYVSRRHDDEEDLVWLDGRSPMRTPPWGGAPEGVWEPLGSYRAAFDPPAWVRLDREAAESGRAGHGGSNHLALEEFALAVRDGRSPLIDVYDAVEWSAVFPLSVQSRARGGEPVAMPDFRKFRKHMKPTRRP
ncbi:Gfo/Idh/MocA family oxidoreductase [Cohnella ginsengisoli]|uniref:Gfo/Idh/MocA family oxidoreductase n=1 Tax=Cohnella ginsengisoli TaxID=425004 RepID=A0A9X4KLT7_9BACL|nr:Gfo/Idh/MocA family oxidoreductase [Cohnella ginsengisoli]MDG0794413.1 Gfo/Idh/MocA family oxidoreductase [Cohnella ginsengisoli]